MRNKRRQHVPRRCLFAACFIAGALFLVGAPVARAQGRQGGPVVRIDGDPHLARGINSPLELEAFLDGIMTANLRDMHVAGATVAIVKDGALYFAKGYGFSDVDRRVPVNAERTLFRIGSTSKLFTWTAIMQLVERGKLDLDADVNRYLDFQIPRTYPQPITLRHIMTHAAGFEEDSRDLFTEDSAQMMSLGRWLATHIPRRVRPPGVHSSYSNYATALAGYVVQRASGMLWDDYIEHELLTPLGMSQTTTRQPLPARFRDAMSDGYTWGNGSFTAHKFEIVTGAAPAGSISASATDMAKFMIAHLNNGVLNGVRILSETTATRMHARAFGHDPRLPGFALGFYEKSSHGLRIIGHGGDTRWFHSDLALIPSERLGVFVSYNTNTGSALSFGPFLTQFLDHYYPTSSVAPEQQMAESDAKRQREQVVGEYAFNRRSYTTFQKSFGLLGDIRVEAADSGRVLMHSPLGDARLVPVAPMLYREELSENLVAFATNGSGPAAFGFLSVAPMMVMERVPWWQAIRLHWTVLGLSVAMFVATILTAVRRLVRRRTGASLLADALPYRWLLVSIATLNLVFLVVVTTVLVASGGLLNGPLIWLKLALALPLLGAILVIAAVFACVSLWRGHIGTRGARLRYSATVVVAILFLWSLQQWNLLGWRI